MKIRKSLFIIPLCILLLSFSATPAFARHVEGIIDGPVCSVHHASVVHDVPQQVAMTETVKFSESLVSYGDTGEDVKQLQQQLKALGYLDAEPDGSFGPQTRKALHLYQQVNNQDVGDSVQLSVFQDNRIENCEEAVDKYWGVNGYGNAGRLIIPELNISVALFWKWPDADGQAIVDRYDSAAYHVYYHYVADHSDQAFAPLPGACVGTTGYIEYADGTIQNIICTGAGEGYNDGYCLYDFNGRSMYEFSAFMTMYTCLYNWQHIFICTWEVY